DPVEPVEGDEADGVQPKLPGPFQPKIPMPGAPGPNVGAPGAGGQVANWTRDALVRFVDPDVTPGKTYQYEIQVILKNPNYGKKDKVEFGKLADVERLESKPEFTPSMSIPFESALFCVDQHLLDEAAKNAAPKKKEVDLQLLAKDQVAFQIHEWLPMAGEAGKNADPFVIGDWVIAERVKVRRGESIGREAVVVVPVWKEKQDDFEVPRRIIEHPNTKKPKEEKKAKGFRTNFKCYTYRPFLDDITCGKHLRSK